MAADLDNDGCLCRFLLCDVACAAVGRFLATFGRARDGSGWFCMSKPEFTNIGRNVKFVGFPHFFRLLLVVAFSHFGRHLAGGHGWPVFARNGVWAFS